MSEERGQTVEEILHERGESHVQGQKQEHPGVGGVSEQGASTGQEASEQSSAQGGGAVGRETVEGVLGAHGATQGGAEHVGGHEKGQVQTQADTKAH